MKIKNSQKNISTLYAIIMGMVVFFIVFLLCIIFPREIHLFSYGFSDDIFEDCLFYSLTSTISSIIALHYSTSDERRTFLKSFACFFFVIPLSILIISFFIAIFARENPVEIFLGLFLLQFIPWLITHTHTAILLILGVNIFSSTITAYVISKKIK